MITLDDVRIEEFGLYVEEGHNHPVISNFNNKTMHIPGRPGVWDFGAEIHDKTFSFPIASNSRDLIELQRRFNDFIAYMTDDYGKPKLRKLVIDYEQDKYYMVKLAETFSPERVKPFSRFNLPLVAHDPYKYSRVFGDEVVWGSEIITFEWHYLLGHDGSGASQGVKVTGNTTIDVSVDGLAIQPVFEIKGTANNLKIECGKYSFTLPNFSNAKWEIDFEKYLIKRNGQEIMLDIRDFYLMPGSNVVKVTGSNINIDMSIKFRDKYN